MIARLIATGSLIGTGSLFWDEPEANLNPEGHQTRCPNDSSTVPFGHSGIRGESQPCF